MVGMLYENRPDGKVAVTFEDDEEVETVRRAFQAHNDHLRALGNDSSISSYQAAVTAWQGPEQQYLGPSHDELLAKLTYYYETTDESVDIILQQDNGPNRLVNMTNRHHLGQMALYLIESIQFSAQSDDALGELFGGQLG